MSSATILLSALKAQYNLLVNQVSSLTIILWMIDFPDFSVLLFGSMKL